MSDAGPIELNDASEPRDGGGSRRVAIIAAVAVVVATVLGGGAFAAYSFLAGNGPRPDEALPASTIAVVSVDLDPSAGQKIAAIKSIRKFPTLKENLGLDADDDLRQWIFDLVTEDADCTGLDFEDDVLPWLGKRAAFAAVDLGEDDPAPAIALQVSDTAGAEKGFDAIVECTDPGDDFAFVVGEDYLIASDSAEHAQAILDGGERTPLADDAAYQKWTGEAGDAGVLSFYISKKAADYALSLADELFGALGEGLTEFDAGELEGGFDAGEFEDGGFTAGSSAATSARGEDPFEAMEDALKDFQGLGGTVRFAGGGMELSLAAGGINTAKGSAGIGDELGDLPGDTAVALGFGVPDDFAAKYLDQIEDVFGPDFLAEAEEETGLEIPEDVQTLLGDAVTLSLGGDAPDSPDSLEGPADLPLGLLIHGDADKISAVIEKIEEGLGMSLSDLPLNVETADGKVALSPGDYGDELLDNGDLGSEVGFRSAIPDADRVEGAIYVDFESDWLDLLVDVIADEEGSDTAREVEENLEPLRSLGISSWTDGDVSHGLVKISTD